VLPLLKGSPAEAWAKIDQDHPRALEMACRVVEEAIAENMGGEAEEWVKEMEDKCKSKIKEVVTTEPPKPSGQPLPGLDPPQEDLDEEQADKELLEKDEAERKDLEIQFIEPSEEQVERWEQDKTDVEERRVARVERAEERVQARREECCRRIQTSVLPRVRRVREMRAMRDMVRQYGGGLATLKYLISEHLYSNVLSLDLADPANHPELLDEEEGKEEEGGTPPPPPRRGRRGRPRGSRYPKKPWARTTQPTSPPSRSPGRSASPTARTGSLCRRAGLLAGPGCGR